jgi:hypothetical protein
MYWNNGGEEKLQVRGWLISAILVKISHLQDKTASLIEPVRDWVCDLNADAETATLGLRPDHCWQFL